MININSLNSWFPMEELNNAEVNDEEVLESKDLLRSDNEEKQTLFRLFGIEMTAPKGLKNPRLVYISFIAVNIFLLIFLKNLIAN